MILSIIVASPALFQLELRTMHTSKYSRLLWLIMIPDIILSGGYSFWRMARILSLHHFSLDRFLLYITTSSIDFHIMNMKLASLTLLSTLAITSCQTTNPYTGAPQTSRSTSGALIGGIVGAGLGSLTGSGSTDRRQKAMIGAGIGALTGGVIGNYMDKQESELRRQLQGSGVSVTRSGHDLILNMPGDITFATDSSRVNSQFINTLNSVGIVLAKYNKTMVNIAGHTDNVGARSYNFQLSERRAQSVARYLSSRGVVSQRMLISGSGPDQPIASNSTATGRQKNRRVSIRLVPNRQ